MQGAGSKSKVIVNIFKVSDGVTRMKPQADQINSSLLALNLTIQPTSACQSTFNEANRCSSKFRK